MIGGPGGYGLRDSPAISVRSRRITNSATFRIEPASTAETGVGPSAWASGIQVCSGASPALVAVAEQQENEGEIQHRPIAACGRGQQRAPTHRRRAGTESGKRGQIEHHGTEQRERDPDAADHEEFPGRRDRLRGARQSDDQHGRDGRRLDRHPGHAEIVGQSASNIPPTKHWYATW